MKFMKCLFWLCFFLLIIGCQCSAQETRPPVPPAHPIDVGRGLVYVTPFKGKAGTVVWHHMFQDRVTTVYTPVMDSTKYTFNLILQDFDNNTSAGYIINGPYGVENSGEGGIHVIGTSSHDFPVIYYNKDKKVDYQCNEKIQSPHTRYMVLLKENDVKIINNTDHLTIADNGTEIVCFYFKKIDSELRVIREVVNRNILIYKEEEPTTTTVVTTTPTTTTVATTISTTTERPTTSTSTTPRREGIEGNTPKVDDDAPDNSSTIVGCAVGALALILLAAFVGYKIHQYCKNPRHPEYTVHMVTPAVQDRPLPTPPKRPSDAYSYAYPNNEYSQIIYQEPQLNKRPTMIYEDI